MGSRGGWRRAIAGVAVGLFAAGTMLAAADPSGDARTKGGQQHASERGSVRFATPGDHSEIRRAIPIARRKWAKKRVVMSIGPGKLPRLHRNDILRTAAEVQVTTTCIDFGTPRCIGRHYGFSPREDARIVLASRRQAAGGPHAEVIREANEVRCRQRLPHRNHHCVLVFPPEPTRIRHPHRLPCRPSSCHLNLVLEADHPHARDGQLVLVGADRPNGTVRRDKGRMSAIVLHKRVPAAKRYRTARRTSRSIPVAPSGKAGRRVIYSQRLNRPRKGDVLEASARHLVTLSALPYPSFVGTDVIVTHRPHAVSPSGIARTAISGNGHLTEANGFNCTHGPSEYRSPCRTRKAGAARVTRNVPVPLYLNVVAAAKAKRATPSRGDHLRVLGRGALVARRYRAR